MAHNKYEVSDVITQFLPLMPKGSVPVHHLRTLHALRRCRTAELGGHAEKCNACGHLNISYNSCRNRHCPKCQGLRKESWVIMQEDMMLPVAYYHVVFTLPHELNELCIYNPKLMYNLIFKSAWQTLSTLAKDPKWIGAQTAATMVLHTWSQTLSLHPHVHCIVPNGGITENGDWQFPKRGKSNFLFPVVSMKKIYRAIYLKELKLLLTSRQLKWSKQMVTQQWYRIIKKLYEKDWVVYTKKPFSGVKHVIDYLARYSHRVAITNQRLVDIKEKVIQFNYKDYKDSAKTKEMNLNGTEFIRRFCLHILPPRFRKIRQFGFTANCCKQTKINAARKSLGWKNKVLRNRAMRKQAAIERLFGKGNKCPICKNGEMKTIEVFIPNKDPPVLAQ